MNSMWALFPPAALCLRPPVVSSLGDAATHPALFTDCREIYSSTRFAQTICLSFLDIVYFQPTTQACMRGACGPNDSHFFCMGEFYPSGQCVQFVRCVGVYTNISFLPNNLLCPPPTFKPARKSIAYLLLCQIITRERRFWLTVHSGPDTTSRRIEF